ncbi:MAG: M23 family metallopeptidase [Nitrospinae bacterium]|nr:M23 family metallopeptidase [Nitrospinota bacterium]
MIYNRIIYKLFVLILILSFLLGCAIGDLSSRTRGKGVYHTVERGQTVWRIAKTYGVDIRPLIRVNHLSDTKDLKVGQRLFIPGAKRVQVVDDISSQRGGGGVYHTVEKGQTIWRIAKTYEVDIRPLIRVNHLSDTKDLKVGQRLFIPGAERVLDVSLYIPPHRKGLSVIEDEEKRSYHVKDVLFRWPVKGKITSLFGIGEKRRHEGIDISAPKGTPISAAADGKVIFSGRGPTGYGRIVIIKHPKDFFTVYAHNRKNLVSMDQYVKAGEKIAEVGDSGRTTGSHLHFEIRFKKSSVDPMPYLSL